MQISWPLLVRTLHVVCAALWFGGIAFATLVLRPAVEAAGEHGKGLMATLQRRGGLSRFMGAAAGGAILTGAILYGHYGYHKAPFETVPSTILTIGAMAALGGWIFGFVGMLPLQRRMAALAQAVAPTGPTPEQGARMRKLQESLAVRGRIVATLISAAFILMAGRGVVA